MKTAENKEVATQTEKKKQNKWKFFIGVAVGITLYIGFKFLIK
jgi:hypothetical protein